MARKQKKRTEASSSQGVFVTRNQALRKLQLSLAQFRKLCILKGIYPREPTHKRRGQDKTYYLAKDIAFLAHDPIIESLRLHKTWAKRVTKATAKKELNRVKVLMQNKPRYKLDHVIRERYPTFQDALRDLDDAISMLALYAGLPSGAVSFRTVAFSRRLLLEFHSWVLRERALRKVFISIKGIYYQADVAGTPVTWVIPHKFVQTFPEDVDRRVMSSFLEFYQTLVGFVAFRLYHCSGLHYPPAFDKQIEDAGESLLSIILDSKSAVPSTSTSTSTSTTSSSTSSTEKEVDNRLSALEGNLATIVENDHGEEVEVEDDSSSDENDEEEVRTFADAITDEEKEVQRLQNLFSGLKIFLSRETNVDSLQFIIRCCGGTVSWESEAAPFSENDESITHQIMDRPSQSHRFLSRDYVQPQWVYDSINARVLLPITEYLPGQELPAHLSPFVNTETASYVPDRAIEIKNLKAKILAGKPIDGQGEDGAVEMADDSDTEAKGGAGNSDEEDEEEEEDEDEIEARYQRELEAEAAGIAFSKAQEKVTTTTTAKEIKQAKKQQALEREKAEDSERKKLAEIMIPSKKTRRLYQRVTNAQAKKAARVQRLETKRDALKQSKKE